MGLSESLLNFYNRFKIGIVTLGIPGFSDESVASRHFYSKLDSSRYQELYVEKWNAASRKIDSWPDTGAYTEINRWIMSSPTTTNKMRSTAFVTTMNEQNNRDPKLSNPCHKCGKLGHWQRECPLTKLGNKPQTRSEERKVDNKEEVVSKQSEHVKKKKKKKA